MNMKIQHFTISLFVLLSFAVISIWSFSLYWINDAANAEKQIVNRLHWQAQLDQLQIIQLQWLQQKSFELNEWMEVNTDAQLRLVYINRFYQQFPEIRRIQILDLNTHESQPAGFPTGCLQLTKIEITPLINFQLPQAYSCFFNHQPVMGLITELHPLGSAQRLVILMDYFSFLDEFERLTDKYFYRPDKTLGAHLYIESGVDDQQNILSYEFQQGDSKLGSLTVLSPVSSYLDIWKQQFWVIPALLVLLAFGFVTFNRAIIAPLLLITQKMKKVVVNQRPGTSYDLHQLTPGLSLLHKYFLQLTYMTKNDPLTGLNNQVIFEERLQQAILEGKRSGRKYALALVDVNHFYKVNKKYGHYMGDGLLKQLAKRLNNGLRESDSLARLEKDNFALLFEFIDEGHITSLIEKLHQSLSKTFIVYGRSINIGVSIGVAIYPDHALDMEELEMKANDALLKAHQGDWPVVMTQHSDQIDYSGFSLIQSFRKALDNKDFKLVYQPVMDLNNHSTRYFEALLRWKQPEVHTQSIEKTIELAEKNLLIKPLSQWIIETACLQLQKMTNNPVKIAVNLSMIDFHDKELPDRIGDTLQRFSVVPEQLLVEITEGQFMQEPVKVIAILTRLSKMGISLSIDDFGTGQASLTYLKKLPVEKLKIDQSFVKDMVTDEEDRSIVEATIKLAHTLGIEVVAEGVESAEILELLIQMGCDYVQGYYISKPIEQKDIVKWIVDKN